MLKKTIQFEDYSEPPVTVEQDFYFNFTKLEVIEMIEVEDLEGTLKRLQETEDGPEAYALFKKIILSAYGEKNAFGGFDKEDAAGRPLYKRFEASPACSELILAFLQDPMSGAGFIEGCLPPKLVADAKKALAENPSNAQVGQMVLDAAARQADPATAIAPGTPPIGQEQMLADLQAAEAKAKTFNEYTEPDLLAMSDEEFAKLVPVSSPKDMTQAQLLIAFKRKNAK